MNRNVIAGILVLIALGCFLLSYLTIKHSEIISRPQVHVEDTPTVGRIVWYTSIPHRHADRITNAFKLKHGIDVMVVRSSTFLIREKLFSEIKNNTIKADVLTIADVGTYIELVNRGLLLDYRSRQYQDYPKKFKDLNKWSVFAGFGICMAYNKDRIHTPPKNWSDLLDAKWKGRIGLEDINTAGSQYGQYYMLRNELGASFWKTLLSTQKPIIYYRTEELAHALLKGEIDVAGQFSIHTVYDYKVKRKTAIEGIYPSEGIPFIINPVAILCRTNCLKESKKFFDYLLSEEGQIIMQRLNFKYSVRTGMTSLDGIPKMSELNILLPEYGTDYLEKRTQYIQEFNRFYSEKKIENDGRQPK